MRVVRDLMQTPSPWLRRQGTDADVVLLARVRMSRNLSGHRFPRRASASDRDAVRDTVERAVQQVEGLQQAHRLDLEDLDETPRRILEERQLTPSPQRGRPQQLIVADDESQACLVNGEDHVLIQAQESGLELQATFDACDALDVELDSRLDFAYSETYGFLTSRPSCAGTGLRATVLMHLPGVGVGDTRDVVAGELRNRGLRFQALRLHDEPVDAPLYLVSNEETLGKREGEIVRNLDEAVRVIVDRERQGRERMLSGAQTLLADRVWRSYGILRQARLLKARETLRHASRLLLGVQLGLLEIPAATLVELFALSQDAHTRMRMQAGRKNSDLDVEEWRAERVRNELQGSNG